MWWRWLFGCDEWLLLHKCSSTTNGLFYYEWTQHSLVALFGCNECLMFHECYSFTAGLFYRKWQQDSLVALFWLRWVANLPQMQFYHEWSLRCLFALFAMSGYSTTNDISGWVTVSHKPKLHHSQMKHAQPRHKSAQFPSIKKCKVGPGVAILNYCALSPCYTNQFKFFSPTYPCF